MKDLKTEEQRSKALLVLIDEFKDRYCRFRYNPWLGRQVSKWLMDGLICRWEVGKDNAYFRLEAGEAGGAPWNSQFVIEINLERLNLYVQAPVTFKQTERAGQEFARWAESYVQLANGTCLEHYFIGTKD